jgi:hypothetical protein
VFGLSALENSPPQKMQVGPGGVLAQRQLLLAGACIWRVYYSMSATLATKTSLQSLFSSSCHCLHFHAPGVILLLILQSTSISFSN